MTEPIFIDDPAPRRRHQALPRRPRRRSRRRLLPGRRGRTHHYGLGSSVTKANPLDIGIILADGGHRLMLLDAPRYGYKLDTNGDVIHR